MQTKKRISILKVNPSKKKRSKTTVRKKRNARRRKTSTTRRRSPSIARRTYKRRRKPATAIAVAANSRKKRKKRKKTYKRKRYAIVSTNNRPKFMLMKNNPESLARQSNPANVTMDLVKASLITAGSRTIVQVLAGFVKTKLNKTDPNKQNIIAELGVPLGIIAGAAYLSKGKNIWLNNLAVGASTVAADNAMAILLSNIDKSGRALNYQRLGDSKESLEGNVNMPPATEENNTNYAMPGFGRFGAGDDYSKPYGSGSSYRTRYLSGGNRFLMGQNKGSNRFLMGQNNNGSNRFLMGRMDNRNNRLIQNPYPNPYSKRDLA